MKKIITVFAACSLSVMLMNSCFKDPPLDIATIGNCDRGDTIINETLIEGYVDMRSYFPGDTVKFMISCLDPFFSISIARYGAQTHIIHQAQNIIGKSQNFDCYSYSYGLEWDALYEFVIPENALSGLYSAEVKGNDNGTSFITFIIKSDLAQSSKEILVLANTNTWEAYNHWGGASFYLHELDDEVRNSVILSFHRPNLRTKPYGDEGHLTGAEMHIYRWLDNENYEYDLICDEDLHSSVPSSQYKVIIIHTHPEYWSKQMMNNLIQFRKNGSNIMYLAGNGLFWKVCLDGDQIEVRKEGESQQLCEGEKGGLWRDVGLSEYRVTGMGYDSRGYDTYAPFEVITHDHWVFEGTNIAEGELFGQESLNGGAASGHETDKASAETPPATVFLAKGTNPDNGGASFLIMTYASSNSEVFSVGSITYCGALSVDSVINRVTKNVLNRFTE